MIKTIALALTATLALALPASAHDVEKNWRPCQYEDSINCVWDSKHMGNGQGKSFKVSKKGKVTYITHRRAHHLINAH